MPDPKQNIKDAKRAQHKLKSLPSFGNKTVASRKQRLMKAYRAFIAKQKDKLVGRVRPKVVYERNSPNQSSRAGAIRLIVIHDTESPERDGKGDLVSIADYFANPAAQVSSHVITDGDGLSARCVPDNRKAWHCAAYNSAALGIEQIGYASRTKSQWPEAQLKETARWIAVWSKKHGIPIKHVGPNGSGVVTHADLGVSGGGHSDPGSGYPLAKVLRYAEDFKKHL
jgi:N-acetyl-anhydromuramyl-L-alanine amidase AmpD